MKYICAANVAPKDSLTVVYVRTTIIMIMIMKMIIITIIIINNINNNGNNNNNNNKLLRIIVLRTMIFIGYLRIMIMINRQKPRLLQQHPGNGLQLRTVRPLKEVVHLVLNILAKP